MMMENYDRADFNLEVRLERKI